MRGIRFSLSLFILLTVLIFYLTRYTDYPSAESSFIGFARYVMIILNTGLLLIILRSIMRSAIPDKIKNISLAVITVLILFFVVETVFMNIPYSHGSGITLGSRVWFRRYWHTNRLGYRDREIDMREITGKKRVLICGDSFVAGHGIENPEERFSDVLGLLLGENYAVFNLGMNGADTRKSFENLTAFPVRPDLIVVCHHPNDIETVIEQKLERWGDRGTGRQLYNGAGNLIIQAGINFPFITDNSYFLNYTVNKAAAVRESLKPHTKVSKEYYLSEEGRKNYLSYYLNDTLFKQHIDALYSFIYLSRKENVPLIIVLFPETHDVTIDYSEEYVNRPIEKFFLNQNIPVLDTYSLIKNFSLEDRAVNWGDAHPSAKVHRAVAEELYRMMK
ncbi:MAG: SGNH/GDSL hydrolase family protein [Bacteroidetes bacterium]|nr:SGNH/GDSL hydrolase family protein [Bacteroidota bacterium]